MTGAQYAVLRECAAANGNNQAYVPPADFTAAVGACLDDGTLEHGRSGFWITAHGRRELARADRLLDPRENDNYGDIGSWRASWNVRT